MGVLEPSGDVELDTGLGGVYWGMVGDSSQVMCLTLETIVFFLEYFIKYKIISSRNRMPS